MTTILTATYGAGRSGEVRGVEPHQQSLCTEPAPEPRPKPEFYEPAELGELHVYEIDDGITYWIAAPDMREAVRVYWDTLEMSGCDLPDYTLSVEVVSSEKAARVQIHDHDDTGETHSAAHWAAKAGKAELLGCSEW